MTLLLSKYVFYKKIKIDKISSRVLEKKWLKTIFGLFIRVKQVIRDKSKLSNYFKVPPPPFENCLRDVPERTVIFKLEYFHFFFSSLRLSASTMPPPQSVSALRPHGTRVQKSLVLTGRREERVRKPSANRKHCTHTTPKRDLVDYNITRGYDALGL